MRPLKVDSGLRKFALMSLQISKCLLRFGEQPRVGSFGRELCCKQIFLGIGPSLKFIQRHPQHNFATNGNFGILKSRRQLLIQQR